MDHEISKPKIYLKEPPSAGYERVTLGGYANDSTPKFAIAPSITQESQGSAPVTARGSVFSQVMSVSSRTASVSGQGARIAKGQPEWSAGNTPEQLVQYNNNTQNGQYDYGPSSTTASIVALTNGRRQASGGPAVNYGTYKALKAPAVPSSITYRHEDRPASAMSMQRPSSSMSMRPTPATSQVVYLGNGRGAKVAPSVIASQQNQNQDQGKFFQITGHKVKKEFSANRLPNHDQPPTLGLLPTNYELGTSPEFSPTSPSSLSPEPYVHARVPTLPPPRDQNDSRSPSPTRNFDGNQPMNFYSSLLGSKGFPLTLGSRPQAPQLGPMMVPSSASNHDISGFDTGIDAVGGDEEPSTAGTTVKQARSDRKIMDLEISNASLMAVNKYLEKKLRNQAKDIQYLKVSNKDPTTGLPYTIETDSEDDISDDDDDNDNTQTSINTENLLNQSPEEAELAEKTKLIEQRMQSHIQFLKSSEKVNNMMRNCLMLTDSLLQQANKSLAYEVDPSDVKYGLQVSNHAFINEADESESAFDHSFSSEPLEAEEEEIDSDDLFGPERYNDTAAESAEVPSRPVLGEIAEEDEEDSGFHTESETPDNQHSSDDD